ncbi:MAG: hypothetical protein KC708_14020 [Anaerolineae bacterium]|nr:hypothetical protein [Anaerolineae bacterium]
MRRSIVILVLLVVGLLVLPASLLAQENYPEVLGTASDDAIEFPSEVPTGYVNVIFDNIRSEAAYSPVIARINDGVTLEEVLAAVGSEDDLAVLSLVTLYGGIEIAPGESESYISEFTPGEYVVFDACEFCDDSEIISFVVSDGEMVEQTPPESDVTLALVDFAFGVPAQIATGPQVWHIHNFGEQWHHAVIFQVDEGTTTLEARNALMSEEAPPYIPVWGWLPSGPGTQSWVTIDLAPGTYVISCFLPDLNGDFSPHMTHGMIQVFVVE